MAKESIITVYRSTGSATPTGLTFGELAYSDGNGQLFIGKNDGSSLWVGAEVTAGALGTSNYLIPTHSAVKTYVDGVVGGGSVVNTLNATGGAVTITGDGGAITNVQNGTANVIRARLADNSLTGVASFSSSNFNVTSGAVSIKAGGVTNGTLQNSSVTVNSGTGLVGGGTVALGGSITLSNVGVLSFNSATGAVQYSPAIASGSATGVASFNSTYFSVDGNGAVSLASAYQATGDTVQAGSFISISANKTISNIGVQTLNGLTGARTLTGDGGAIVGVGNNTIRARLADNSLTGVASFSSSNFDVTSGAVSIKAGGVTNGNLQNSSVTVSAGTGLGGGGSVSLGGSVTLTNLGVTSLNGLTGARTLTGDGGAIFGAGNSTIGARLATTTGATGVASFDGDNFSITNGVVSIKNGGITNAELAASSITFKASTGDPGTAVSLGGSLTVTGTANQVVVASSANTLTVGLPNDVVISGNLTVNGTVVTTNVNNFVVEDPLFMLGTGNSDDTLDLGFYGQYTESATKKYTGLFRDSQDATFQGKYRLFTGLTVEPTTSVNAGGAGYAMATLVARIDGGTF
jgi:hypothetical protein